MSERKIPRYVAPPTFDAYARSLNQRQVDRMLVIEHNATGSMIGLLRKLQAHGRVNDKFELVHAEREPGQDDEEKRADGGPVPSQHEGAT